ncbi:MAG: ribonuclease H-like domain-containing protein [Saprospiraceae bacterium]
MNLNQIKRTLVLDIETASMVVSYDLLDSKSQSFWAKKSNRLHNGSGLARDDAFLANIFDKKAAIFAEFARVICISVGIFEVGKEVESFRIKSFYGNNENEILMAFAKLLERHFYDKYHHTLAGHNLKEFDIPFLCRRMIINKIKLPNLLKIHGARPWQVPHLLDTLELWKFGDYKNYSSLDLLCSVLGIESPKDKMDGSEVSNAFWNGRIEEIKTYCEKDIVATARVMLRLLGSVELEDEKIVFVDEKMLKKNDEGE